ncbi:MAG: hypothetical protein WCI21_08870 [Alphaproteobacteria bacterium]
MFDQFIAMVGKMAERRRNARLTRPQFEAARLEKFRALVRHANARSPYYGEIIAQRGIDIATCTPADFPELTKSILMANFNRIVTDPRVTKQAIADFLTRSKDPNERYLNRFVVMHTSGTSGEVGYFVYAPTDLGRAFGAGGGRRRMRSPLKRRGRGRFRLAFYGATDGHYAGVTSMSLAGRGLLRLLLKVGIFEINAPLAGTLKDLNAFQPDVLAGYTTALKMLGEKQKSGELDIHPVGIGATGETVTKADMAFLSEAFGGASVTSAYGCTEHLGLGSSNPGGETMTLNDNDLIFEFRDDHSLITNLFNYTMPLIRYRMSDILRPVSGPNDRELVIENLVGRTERTPVFTNAAGQSDFISPHTINEVFVAGVTRFQFQITGEASFRFPICLDPALDAAGQARAVARIEARLGEILAQKDMGNVTFEVPVVDDIPVNAKTRKFQLIVDLRKA